MALVVVFLCFFVVSSLSLFSFFLTPPKWPHVNRGPCVCLYRALVVDSDRDNAMWSY